MQNQGSLESTTLASLLRTMQQERATGTLALADEEHRCSLYFLFGHLFHAAGEDGQEGESAVLEALRWTQGTFTFDPRAKLPPEETINSSTGDLLAEWERRQVVAAAEASAAAEIEEEPAAAVPAAPVSWPAPVAAEFREGTAREEAPERAVASVRTEEPAGRSWREVPRPTLAAPPPIGAAAPASPPRPLAVPAPGAAISTPPPPPRSAAPPTPATTTAGAVGPQGRVLLPLPAGTPVHEGLKATFVDFPRMLRTVSEDGVTGYVRLREAQGIAGHLLFLDGAILAAQLATGTTVLGETEALRSMAREVTSGRGLIDVVTLEPGTAESLGTLVGAPARFTGLPARFINFTSLLEFLAEDHTTGAVLAITPEATGILLLRDGVNVGTYTSTAANLVADPGPVADLCGQRETRIEVLSASGGANRPLDLSVIEPAAPAR